MNQQTKTNELPESLSDQSDAGVHLHSEGVDAAASPAKTAVGAQESISDFHAAKLDERRYHWVMEWRLVGYTALVLCVLFAMTVASYAYHSRRTPSTLLSRADAAAAEGNLDEEVRWLNTYLIMVPEDTQVFVRAALSADQNAETGTRKQLASRIAQAQKRLSQALAFLPDTDANQETRRDLRRRLIERQLQLGGYEYKNVERQLIDHLDPPRDDPQPYRWMAQALLGQVRELIYQLRPRDRHDQATEFWAWLADQPPGLVVIEALRQDPDDLELTANLFALLASHPEHFGRGVEGGSQSVDEFQQTLGTLDDRATETIHEVLSRLQQRADSQSRILLYRYALLSGKLEQAQALITEAADEAAKRLVTLLAEDEEGDNGAQAESTAWKLTEQEREVIADYEAVYLAAQSIASRLRVGGGIAGAGDNAAAGTDVANADDQDAKQASEWLKLLRDLGTDRVRVSPAIVKSVYLTSGVLEQIRGEVQSAIEIWTAGLEVLSSDDLDLRGGIAWTLSQSADSPRMRDRAEQAVEEFERLVDAKGRELLQMSNNQAGPAQRAAIADQISNARWRARISRAQLLASGPPLAESDRRIIESLRGINSRELDLDPSVVITGLGILTAAYQRQSAWDLAAQVLEVASQAYPDNRELLEASGNAWTRAGNRSQAQKQWQRARLSNNPETRVAVLEAEFANQLRLPPDQRDIDALRSQVRGLRDLLATSPGSFRAEKLRLELLQAQLPPQDSESGIEQYLQSAELANRVVELSDANPDNVVLQTYAAKRLAASGQADKAAKIADRLQQTERIKGDELAILKAQLLSASRKHREAAEGLLEYARSQDELSIELVMQAAEAASRANESGLLEQALLLVPQARRSPYIWFQLYQAALSQNDAALADEYLQQLHAVEGYAQADASDRKPTYSWFIDARQLANKLLARGNVQWDDSDLREAERLVQQIQSARPHWGHALAIRGWLAYATGNRRSAIDYLQQGINAGDTQMLTRQLLWQALIAEGRDEEAQQQIELASIAAQADVDPYDEVAIGLDLRRGRYAQALEAAEQVAADRPNDAIAQLVYAKIVLSAYDHMAAGRTVASETTIEREELLARAKQAIKKAEQQAFKPTEKFSVLSTRLQMLIGLKDEPAIEAMSESLANSELPVADRMLLQAKAHVALGDLDQAIKDLEASNELSPRSRTQTLLVRLLRSRGRGQESLKVLRQSFRQDPTNPVLRTELATQLAASGEAIDWDEIGKLLSGDQAATSQNRLVYALLLATRGNEVQRKEAVRLLRSLSGSGVEIALDASRVQAALMLELASNSSSLSDSDRESYRQEARQIFERLATAEAPQLVDLTRYCTFLIESGTQEDLEQAQQMLTRLKSMPNAAVEVLKVEMFLARKGSGRDAIPEVVRQWASDPEIVQQTKAKGAIETAAGEALLEAGFINEGIDWFKRAYEANENAFTAYGLALLRVGRFQQAADVSASQFRDSGNLGAVALLVKALLAENSEALVRKHRSVVDAALAKFPENQSLLESLATLEMQNGNDERAIGLFQKVLKGDPRRIRALNNLAMALAEIPGRAIEGLKPIDQAIHFAGEKPELLDTKGTVLLRARKLPEAKAVFENAIEKSEGKEPRFFFHLIQTLMEMGEEPSATKLWKQLDVDRLNPQGLTLEEQDTLKEYINRFGKPQAGNTAEKGQT